MSKLAPTVYRTLGEGEHSKVLEKSRIVAVFVEVAGGYGLMMNSATYMSQEERAALIQAARDSPTRD